MPFDWQRHFDAYRVLGRRCRVITAEENRPVGSEPLERWGRRAGQGTPRSSAGAIDGRQRAHCPLLRQLVDDHYNRENAEVKPSCQRANYPGSIFAGQPGGSHVHTSATGGW